ncbi:MAG TPA: cobalamin B12-binding domain-containing protein, partial [Candidatus Brocadiia bacterium]|nr:cobalamin B12-binding domain-containing protein [Candidatus Brocadiia bacterium]
MAPPVLLINPNRMQPPVTPVGLDLVGQALREGGFEVRFLDLAFEASVEGALAKALAQEPLLVGVSARNLDDCYYASQDFCLAETKRLLGVVGGLTAAPVVVGGAGFSVAPKAALGFLGCRWGVRGDGEAAFVALARRVLPGGAPMAGNPNLRGATTGNDDMLRPVFYLSSDLGPDPDKLVEDMIGGDPRFFFASRRRSLEN